ncbi:TlpA disulfide reductase family protein [Roseomonas sp. CECT 9278]|uniref:TlpA family protein disulfide reductase n=1 Tax=Roseomonas sp. CECT 9278 TaxID=2845823 RepID=UPI001E345E40|nr:TlpA disulfide reductase family protein [Roseomonas sp. CECT 9278]CAH0311931.1 Thiol-disulfide oxidoreductase ResA [Roseomonas sp. CECT 9278]
MLVPTRRSVLLAAPALAAATLIQAGLPARPAIAATAHGLNRLREADAALPDISFTDSRGNAQEVADFRGQGLVLNLWATWCPPCVAEMPALDRLARMLAPDGILVLPLSSDRGGLPVVQAFYERTGVKALGIWLDPRGAAGRALGARGLPTTLIIDRGGRERARLEGDAAWDAPDFVSAIRRLVAPASRAGGAA